MFIYILISLILTGLSLINPKREIIKKIVYLFVGVFLCTSYFNGSDWRQYEIMYKLATFKDINGFYAEKGFYIYMCIFKIFGFNFFEFFIITKFIIYYIFYKVLTKNPNFYLVLNIFYCQIGLILFIDCPLRNLIAIGLFLLGIQELNKGRKLSFVFYIVLATTFHQSAIFFIVIPLVYKMRKLSSIKLIILVFFCYVLFISQNLLIKLLEYLPFFQERLFHLLGSEYSEGKIFTLGNLEKILMIIIMLYYHYKNKKNWKIIFLAVLYLILYRIGTTFPILTRMALYLQIFYIFGIGLIIEKIRKSFKLILILLFGLYGVLIIYKITNNTYKYIPYTNYLKYIGVEKPSYEYRSKYNLIKWSERTGKSIEELRRN